jgi:hypothetical protein
MGFNFIEGDFAIPALVVEMGDFLRRDFQMIGQARKEAYGFLFIDTVFNHSEREGDGAAGFLLCASHLSRVHFL